MSIDTILNYLGFVAIAIGVGFVSWLITGLVDKCPKCAKLHAKSPVGSYQTGQRIMSRVENFSEDIQNDKG